MRERDTVGIVGPSFPRSKEVSGVRSSSRNPKIQWMLLVREEREDGTWMWMRRVWCGAPWGEASFHMLIGAWRCFKERIEEMHGGGENTTRGHRMND